MPHYIHHLPGRLRIKSRQLKRNPGAISSACSLLANHHGIDAVEANSVTGSLLITYDPQQHHPDQLLAILSGAGLIADGTATPPPPEEDRLTVTMTDVGGKIGKAVLGMLVEKAVERSALALVGAIL